MIGLDTNVLLRLFVLDDANQAGAARKFIEEQCSVEQPGFVNLVVVSEFAWALSQSYDYSRQEIADAIELILLYDSLLVDRRELVAAALQSFRSGGTEFPDVLINAINRANGCETTATFDRKAAKLDGFRFVR